MSAHIPPPIGSSVRAEGVELTPENIFQDETVDDLRRHICMLTTALKNCAYCEPTSSQLPSSTSGDLRNKFNLLGHIATVLTAGTSRDPNAASVHAVAGLFEADRISSLIATMDTRPQPPQKSQLSPVPVGDAEQAKNLLSLNVCFETDDKDLTFRQHLEDVATILSYFLHWQPNPDLTRSQARAHFLLFIVRRAFRKLSARLHNMPKIWGEDPIVIMEDWFNDLGLAADINVNVTFARGYNRTILERLARHGVSSVSGNYTVTSDNVRGWLSVLSSILNTLQGYLPEGRKAPPSHQETVDILRELDLLDTILGSTLFAALRCSGVALRLHERYEKCQTQRRQVWVEEVHRRGDGVALHEDLSQHGRLSSDTEGGDMSLLTAVIEPTDDGDNEWSKREPGEDALLHVERYLKTITAWFVASNALSQLKTQNIPLALYHLSTTPSIAIPPEVVQQFRERYLMAVEQKEGRQGVSYNNACTLLNNAFKDETLKGLEPPPIHAEAAIMALAYSSSLAPALEDESDQLPGMQHARAFFTTEQIPIGISKKCCACCDLFARYTTLSTPQDKPLKFILPGTHGIIYPWLSPPFGVPHKVLESMCSKLFAVFCHVARTLEPSLTSTQSSPASITNSLDDLDELRKALYSSHIPADNT